MPVSPRQVGLVAKLLRSRSGIVITDEKTYLVEARLGMLARELGLASAAAVIAELTRRPTPSLVGRVVEAMTTNETSFYRDVHPFNALREVLLPEMIEARRSRRELNIWCAAAATGQEPYTIAMIIRSHFPALSSWKVNIIATDINASVLDRARAGAYSRAEVNRGLPARMLVEYFTCDGDRWTIAESIRSMVDFRIGNLVGDLPQMPLMDIVLLRNVLIYFDKPTKQRVLKTVVDRMRSDAHLILGGAETTLHVDAGFKRRDLPRCSCFNRIATLVSERAQRLKQVG